MAKKVDFTDSSLTTRSKRMLSKYFSDLIKDRNDAIFDDKMLDLMLEYAKHPGKVQEVREYCNKIGYSQSIKHYDLIKEQLESFSEDNHPSFRWNENYQKAKRYWMERFSKANLKPLVYHSDADIADALRVKSTHAGWTGVLSGHKYKEDNLEDIFKRFHSVVEKAKQDGSFNRLIMIGTRTQCQNPYDDEGCEKFTEKGQIKHKTRMVSMVDMMFVICECIWAVPLQDYMSKYTNWCAGGKNDAAISELVHDYLSRHHRWASIDFSRFDQSISDWILYDVFDIFKEAFKNDPNFDEELWNIMVYDIIHKRFLDGEGKVWYSRKGIGSGFRFTNAMGNMANMLMKTTYSFSIGRRPEDDPCIVMGDDNLLFTNVINLKDMSTYLMKNFGVTINLDKIDEGISHVDDPKFLSRLWTEKGPYREGKTCCAKLMFPERFRKYDTFEPRDVFYAYCLAYGEGMNEIFHVDKFLTDNRFRHRSEMWKKGSEHLPGVIRYNILYGNVA